MQVDGLQEAGPERHIPPARLRSDIETGLDSNIRHTFWQLRSHLSATPVPDASVDCVIVRTYVLCDPAALCHVCRSYPGGALRGGRIVL